MERYSPEDRWIALAAISRLSEGCPCGRRPWSPGLPPASHSGHCPFRPGSAMEVCPDGRVGYALSPEGSADYERGYREKRKAGRLVDLGPSLERIAPEPPAAIAQDLAFPPLAPAHAGFRTLRTCALDAELEFAVPPGAPRARARADLSAEGFPGLRMGATKGNYGANVYLAGEMRVTIWPQEDALCFQALDTLEEGPAFHYDSQSTLDTLARLVWKMNDERPRIFHFDTVFMNYEMYLHLFGQDERTARGLGGTFGYENLARLWGITFLCPEGMHSREAFVTSSRQGPVFANGPHTTLCDGRGFSVAHHCAMVMPPAHSAPGMPWGTRIRPEFKPGRRARGA